MAATHLGQTTDCPFQRPTRPGQRSLPYLQPVGDTVLALRLGLHPGQLGTAAFSGTWNGIVLS
eukprot:6632480-Alexandrium_andersonii.AAC.1